MTSLLFHAAILSCCIFSWSHTNPERLRFTRTFYNVTTPENSVSRTLVSSSERMGIHRESQDDVTFKITSGDPDRIFKLEDKPMGDFIFLVLRTRGGSSVVLNRERKDKFVLTVKAFSTRSSLEVTTIIYVRVLDRNDLSPIFFPSSYNATLPEDFHLYKPILTVSAEDADLGLNGEVIYSIKEPSEHFAVHPFTGVLTLTNPLKYAERSVYDLTIVAQDRATVFRGGGKPSFASVSVRVRQVNLFGPEIYVYVLQEPSAHRLGWTYAVARVLDRDEGIHGEIEDVKIVNGELSSFFTVAQVDENNNRTEYNIVLLNSFKGDIFSLVNLSLEVIDRGFPQRKSYKGISFRLKRVVDTDPKFLNEFYEIRVPEYLPQGSPIIRLSILNKEQFLSNKFSIVIKEGNVNKSFRFYDKKLVLCTIKPLDSEKLRVFTLSLVIVDKHGNSIGSTAKVKVNVVDYNDNAPVFNDTPEEIWINENQPAGTHVVKVLATDKDSEDNGQITYSLANINRIPFEIDPLSGVLRTTQPLDYETAKHIYFIKVRASDSGTDFRRETEKTFTVRVRNINDNSPEFTKAECSLSIPRNLKVGSELFSITATDLDESDILSYSVSSTHGTNCIKIDAAKGMLSLQCDLNELSTTEWGVNITANDGIHKAQSYLRIFVVTMQLDSEELNLAQYSCRNFDSLKEEPKISKFNSLSLLSGDIDYGSIPSNDRDNLHYPLFENLPESLNIKESIPVGEIVYKLRAFDDDKGINGKIVYGLTSRPEDFVVKVDADSGEIIVYSEINYEDQNKYSLNVSVCDLGLPQKCSFGNIILNILNTNSFAPKFKESHYKLNIPENTEIGETLLKVEATDDDLNLSQNVSYYITSNPHFAIDQSGSITLKTPLDRETSKTHTITVKAADGEVNSNDTLYTEVVVTFYIQDVNDNVPVFVNTHLAANVPEDLPIGSIVFLVIAVDRDENENGDVHFSLDNELFKIDSFTGVIRLKSKLDFETKSEHRLVVTATDRGTPGLSSSETVVVKVTDVDENLFPPSFEEVVFGGSVKENLPAGTLVTSLSAVDADATGRDSEMFYYLQGGSGLGQFTISEQGQIYTSAILDAERADHYWLTVVAKDCGLVPLSTKTQVYISVLDENDRLPLTVEPFYTFTVEENLPSLTVVGYLSAVDDDVSGTNIHTGDIRKATNISYSLSPSSIALPFTVDSQTGLISTTRLLDHEDVREYVLKVVVSDRGTPSLTSETDVLITVLDVNDHAPQFTQDHYVIEPLYSLQIFPSVVALDKDEGSKGKVVYSISMDSPFTINSETGAIFPFTTLKAGAEYECQVKASDNGVPRRSSITKVTVYIPESASPLSKAKQVNKVMVKVQESLRPGEVVMQFNSSASNKGPTAYLITGGDGANNFALVRDRLLLVGKLNCETMQSMALNIAALNGTNIWNTQMEIQILDVNEYNPKFSQSHYLLNVSEDTPEDSILTTFQAQDSDVNSSFHFSLHNRHPGSDMFTLDRITGDLILTGYLDRETASSHLLTIQVSDGVENQKHGYARVLIDVVDVNDNPPRFATESMTLRVSEDLEIGDVVETLVAADLDVGENGEIKYSIVSGNKNETFKVNSETGYLRLNKALDTYRLTSFHLIIRAIDKGSPPLEARLNVLIDVVPSEKKGPKCIESSPWTEILESAAVGDVIGYINVHTLPYLTYELVSGDPEGTFSVNPSTGDIVLTAPLDHETTQLYNITVRITSRAGLYTDCSLVIYVTDYNDNTPFFKQESYIGFVKEDDPIGSLVMSENGPLKIQVGDYDSGENAMFEFLLKGKGKEFLNVDLITGTVRTSGELDYETVKEIEVLLSVRDLGRPSLTSTALASVKVIVKDVNDCKPRFLQRGYNVTVMLPTEKDIFLVQVLAEDADTEEVTWLQYTITSGNEDGAFYMDKNTGEIYIEDPDKLYPRRIVVGVHDGVFKDTTTVDISVKHHHPSALRFQKDIYHAAVMENSTKSSVVVVVSLLGSFIDENIRFSILNRKRNPSFSIGPTSGIVSTSGAVFDREEQNYYNLIVQAYSLDRDLIAFTKVNVSILDVNDNCPRFTNTPYRAIVMGNATKGDFVFKISATDLDTGENGEVRFELDQPGSEMFRIGRKSGEIRVKNLGLQTKREITVKITAYDGGIIPCYSSTTIVVSVVDASAPQWQRTAYTGSVSEDAKLLSPIALSLKATADHKVVYQLINSSDFLLRHDTGELQVYTSLDREKFHTYHLQVRATDSVTGSSSDTLVVLEVTDINDNPPVFLEERYSTRVPEDAPEGTIVLGVVAMDLDAGHNGTVRYSLLDSHFKIDPVNGTLVLLRSLDYETKKHHTIKVVATDMGVPSLLSHVYVDIEVLNVNDNPPEFSSSTSKFVVAQHVNRGFLVGKVIAYDKDKDKINFRTKVQNGVFHIDDFGVITVRNPKLLTSNTNFLINITVEDGIYSTNGFVEINVLSSNRQPPKFSRDFYETKVDENKPAGSPVIRVAAFDKDFGIFGNVTYFLPPQKSTKFFAVDKYSGDIKTRTPLDREQDPYHVIHIMAKDGGGLLSWSKVKVNVIDENDNKPFFELPHYYGCVSKGLAINQNIIKLTATDIDEGMHGSARYSIVNAEPPEAKTWLHIEPVNGSITLNNPNLLRGPTIKLTVRASDSGTPPLYSDVILRLHTSHDKQSSPLRSFPSRMRIPLDAKQGYIVHRFEENQHHKTKMLISGQGDIFGINSNGELFVKRHPILKHNKVGLLVQAQKEEFAICAFYEINIETYSTRNNLTFVQERVEISLPENIAVGTSVFKVEINEDEPTVLFSMAPSKVFSIDPMTGWITVTAPLDREDQDSHDVIVTASTSLTSQSTSVVIINVTDVNDNPHIFNQDVYHVAVKEDSPTGTEVARLSLVDPDLADDVIHYVILEGDDDAMFTMSFTGQVLLAKSLDREAQTDYSLVVIASDGVFIASTIVNVLVIDVNDEPHSCVHSLYNISLEESLPPGHLIVSILTSDPDLESSLLYHLASKDQAKFYVDNHGDLRLKQYLDRELNPEHTVEVTVKDPHHPEWVCSSVVHIIVNDINDNTPSFAVSNETVMLTEDAIVGMIVTKITVLDYDEGLNRTIHYALVNQNGLFNLSSTSGLLVLAKPLPNGPGSVYYVTVRASDLGKPSLSSVSTLQIVVLGMNDDPPVQLSGTFHVSVSEDAPVGSSILQLQSDRRVVIEFSTVVYTILEGNGQGEFDIDRKSGLLTISKPLDYESHQSYQLLILATSVGESSVTSYSSVNVTVLDVNDNTPMFKVNRWSVQIREDIEVGQIVLKLEAIDIDSGSNGMIRYSLDTDSMQQFAIDSFNGILMVLSSLDREKKAQYNISVVATDQGTISLSSTAYVNLEVLDVNDNPPTFLTPNVTTVLQADRMPGWAVFHFAVTDADLTLNSSFIFHITEGNSKDMFRIDSDGTLRTTDKLKIQLGEQHTLVVRVEDSEDPTLSSSTWIYIKVVEPSKHPPILHPMKVWVAIYEQQWNGGDLGVLTSSDLDPYDKLEYSVPSNHHFSVDPRQGTLRARSSLAPGVYNVNVTVSDGKFTTATNVVVTVEPLRQDMLQTSVYIRLSPRIRQQTVASKLPRFLSTLQSAFLRDVRLISIQNGPGSSIGLLIAVDGGADLQVVQEVMDSCGLTGTTPQCDCRNGGVCQRQLQMMPEKTSLLMGEGISFVAPGHSLAYYCICSMGYAGEHCEEIKCLCPPLQVCVPQKVGFTCIPPCSANQTCPAAMTSLVTWSELVICILASTALITVVAVFVAYGRRYRRSSDNKEKNKSWGKQNDQTKKKSKLSNLMMSKKPQIFTGSPNNGIGRNNLECTAATVIEGEVIPLDYLRNINPLTKMENDILHGHSSAPDLATCHVTDVIVLEDPARGLAALDDQLSQEVVQYGFPPPGVPNSLPEELEVTL
ncbi:fat-like cadherin-related tumor suppressor homolog [Macrosteles quadrilineatus]|uniref:fat-like cadherin-related tumor suppressor homolog n=1 Tax=Macrosteles quadrilineatus TaxID=74068 RepID=UPI0023E0A9AA|nr:fat-like cadherin-related tumor suppressor homolog [Macrosteles quadrilineatus]